MSKHDDDRLEEEFREIEATELVGVQNPRIVELEAPTIPGTFEEWQTVITDNFPDLAFAAEICLSVICQLLIKDIANPFAVILVDVPSAGKTITLNFFAEIEELAYATDKFTPASFVSNAANVKKDKLPEIDLLPRITNKTLIVRDFATVFSKRDDDLNELLGMMTRILDGEGFNSDSGIHGKRHYDGEHLFMLLGASTPIPPKVWKMMGSLGSRLFFLNLNSTDKTEDELADQLGNTTYKAREKACKAATTRLLQTLWANNSEGIEWESYKDERTLKLIIARCARLLASLRGVVSTYNEYGDNGKLEASHTTPIIEKPDRINQLLYNLCRGHALASGRAQINEEDVRLAIELAIESAQTERAKLFNALLAAGGELGTADVMQLLNCSRPTAHKEMERLRILKLCTLTQENQGFVGEPEKRIKLQHDLVWFMSDECRTIRNLESINKEKLTLRGVQDVFGTAEQLDVTTPFDNEQEQLL